MTSQMVVVFDVDGVISPAHGQTAWDDDVTAGHLYGPVLVSPAMCREVDALDGFHDAACYWLTDWTHDMRHRMHPFPGRDWPTIADPTPGVTAAQEWAGDWWPALPWWKWWALDEWLTHHPEVRRMAWIDDDLRYDDAETHGLSHRAWTIENALHHAGINARLIAPDTSTGLRPLDVRIIQDLLHGAM